MNRAAVYSELLPRIIKRLFLVGIPAAGLFMVVWYLLHGYELWSSLIGGISGLKFDPSGGIDNAGLIYTVKTQGVSGDIVYKVNNLSQNLIVLVFLLGAWPHANLKAFMRTALWSLALTVVFQVFSIWLNMYYISISPAFADKLHLFWRDSVWHTVMNRVYGFDKFILRYYGAFPVFALALTIGYFSQARTGKKKGKA